MQSRVQRLSHMLFHQLFPQQLDRRQLKKTVRILGCGWNSDIFSTTWRGLVSQVARGAATHILYRRPVEWIERLSDRYRNSKCTSVVVFCPEKKIIFPEKNIWQVIGWRQCALYSSNFGCNTYSCFFRFPTSDFSSCIATPQVWQSLPKQILHTHTCGCFRNCMHSIPRLAARLFMEEASYLAIMCASPQPLKSQHAQNFQRQ